jgi:hypothetical protein
MAEPLHAILLHCETSVEWIPDKLWMKNIDFGNDGIVHL